MNCKYCEKICKNDNSLRNHERLCRNNPNKQILKSNFIEYNKKRKHENIPSSNQFIKAKQEGRIEKVSDETKRKLSKIHQGRSLSEVHKIKISQGMIKAVKENPESYSSSNVNGRTKKVLYKDTILDSSWEYEFAKWCDENNVKWVRNLVGFDYDWDGPRTYFPDFYLPDVNLYVEVKGYERERDLIKYRSVKNLMIVKKDDIKNIQMGQFKLEY